MIRKGVRIAVGCAPLVLVGVMSGCGDGNTEGAATSTTITIDPTSYVTRQPVTTTTTGTTLPPEPGEAAAGEQQYEVQAGDYIALIAGLYEIEAQEIANYNQWPEGIDHVLQPGDIVKIPPGANVPEQEGVTTDPPTDVTTDPDGTQPTSTRPPSTETGNTEPSTGTTAPDNCELGSYTIEAGDTTRIGVAQKFDLTVEQLDAANAGTPGYEAFFPGLEIIIPAATDC